MTKPGGLIQGGIFHLQHLMEAQVHLSVLWKLLHVESKHIVLPFGPTSVFTASLPNIPREWNTTEANMGVDNLLDPDVEIFISPFRDKESLPCSSLNKSMGFGLRKKKA